MSDSFADLWNSSAPSKPVAQKLGSIQSQQSQTTSNRRPQNDLFAQLSSAGSGPPSRTTTPSYTAPTSSKPPTNSKPSSSDAFSSLFSADSGFSSKSSQNMTIAERAAEADRRKHEQFLKNQGQQVQSGMKIDDAWAGLDSLGEGKTTVSATSSELGDDWAFGPSTATTTIIPKSVSTKTANDDDWGLGDLSSGTAPAKTKPQASGSLWDMNDFASSSPLPSQTRSPPNRRPDSPSNDFDFGGREDQDSDLLGDFGSGSRATVATTSGEDDILGALSRPVDEIQKEKEHERERRLEREVCLLHAFAPTLPTLFAYLFTLSLLLLN